MRDLAARYLAGESLRVLCERLDELGIPTSQGSGWQPTTLAALLRNPVFTGRRKDARGRTILTFPPVLDTATWQSVQTKMDAKARRKGIAPTGSALLTSVLYCGKCGGPMYRIVSTNTRRDGTKIRKAYYRCHGRLRQRSTCKNMLSLDLMDRLAEAYMLARVREPYVTRQVVPGAGHDDELAEIDAQLSDLLVKLQTGDIDGGAFGADSARLASERERIKAMPATADEVELIETGETIGEHWYSLGAQGKRTFLIESGTRIDAHADQNRELRMAVNGRQFMPGLNTS